MNAEENQKIDAGVDACLELCDATKRPYTSVAAFIDILKANPIWTADEIIEVQTRVIRALLYRTIPPEKDS